jgi:hypothetical protein
LAVLPGGELVTASVAGASVWEWQQFFYCKNVRNNFCKNFCKFFVKML